jgi:hypothetical protein
MIKVVKRMINLKAAYCDHFGPKCDNAIRVNGALKCDHIKRLITSTIFYITVRLRWTTQQYVNILSLTIFSDNNPKNCTYLHIFDNFARKCSSLNALRVHSNNM